MGLASFISMTGPGPPFWDFITLYEASLTITQILTQYLIFPRFEGSFKKGYPNGQGRVRLGNNTVAWEGTFTNGAPDEEVTEELHKLFTHFHTYPLRMKRSLRRR